MKPNEKEHAEALATIEGYIRDYNAQKLGIPERIQDKLRAILQATTAEQATALAKKATQSALIAFIGAWATGRIPGRITPTNVEQKAAKALSLADYLDSIDEPEQAAKQRERAERIRSLADKVA